MGTGAYSYVHDLFFKIKNLPLFFIVSESLLVTIKIKQMKKNLFGRIGAIAILSASLIACQKDVAPLTEQGPVNLSASFESNTNNPQGITFYALAGNTLDKYSTTNPETLLSSATITGLQPGERVLGLDFRPRNGQLYALGSNSRVYTVNPMTGVATFAFSFTNSMGGAPVLLSGTSFGFDFNPQVDRLRIVSNTGQNLRVVPDNAATGVRGTTFVDGSINPQPASITGVAYDNNVAGTPTTELYALDATVDVMYEIKPPNFGTLVEPLPVKLKLEGGGGFDIAPRNANVTTDIGLGLYEVNKKSTLFQIDVETGDTRIMAKYNKDILYTSLAISPAL